jgi:hypothetical protein
MKGGRELEIITAAIIILFSLQTRLILINLAILLNKLNNLKMPRRMGKRV